MKSYLSSDWAYVWNWEGVLGHKFLAHCEFVLCFVACPYHYRHMQWCQKTNHLSLLVLCLARKKQTSSSAKKQKLVDECFEGQDSFDFQRILLRSHHFCWHRSRKLLQPNNLDPLSWFGVELPQDGRDKHRIYCTYIARLCFPYCFPKSTSCMQILERDSGLAASSFLKSTCRPRYHSLECQAT